MTKQGKRRYNREKERVDKMKLGGLKNRDFKKKEEEKGEKSLKRRAVGKNDGSEKLSRRPEKLSRRPEKLSEGPRNFQEGPRNFQEGPRNFQEGLRKNRAKRGRV